jgi:transposase-like protein
LQRWGTVSEAARQLGVDRSTVHRSMKRYGVDLQQVLDSFTPPADAPTTQIVQISAPSESALEPPKPAPAERNVLKLPASDFTGRHQGDVGRPRRRYY